MLQLLDVRFTYPGSREPVLLLPELALAAGEQLFLFGDSGCGKSTLLALMAGVLVAQQGSVSLLGQDWRGLAAGSRDRRRADHVGVVFQQFNLLPYLSVLDNVRLPARFSARRAARCDGGVDATATRLLDAVGLGATLHGRRADTLSVGQQQRVAAARALLGAPELVIADEPTSALDSTRRDEFMALLCSACRASASGLVFVSHDERLASRFDRRLNLPALNRASAGAAAAVPA
jgi:putative ABC transport system ATP-binding protein